VTKREDKWQMWKKYYNALWLNSLELSTEFCFILFFFSSFFASLQNKNKNKKIKYLSVTLELQLRFWGGFEACVDRWQHSPDSPSPTSCG
jgi:hypothetical protein